jgi:tetratricopeptide (TPR) repeat protein
MLTPAQEHFMRMTAEAESRAAQADDSMAGATGYELMLAKLAEDRRSLKQIQSIEAKIDYKRKVLPDYAAYVAGALAGNGAQDDVLMSAMVWHLDCADYGEALPIAQYALRHGMTLPDQYQRTTATLIAEEVADTELRKNTAKEPMEAMAICQTIDLTLEHDMPDQVRAKLYKAAGYAMREEGKPEAAIEYLRRAMTLHEKVGVKRDIELLERALAKAGTGTETGTYTGTEGNKTKTGGGSDATTA